jgi:hypothetical protein
MWAKRWLVLTMSVAIWGAVLMSVPSAGAWVPWPPPQATPPPPDPQPVPDPLPPPVGHHCHEAPEPSTLVLGLIAAGTIGLGALRRRRAE